MSLIWVAQDAYPHAALNDDLADWVSVPLSQNICGGYYASFESKLTESEQNEQLPIEASANQTQLTFIGQSALIGEVKLRQGERALQADQVIIQRAPHHIESLSAQGHIHYMAPGIKLWGEQAYYLPAQGHFHFDNASYRWYPRHARGSAKQIDIDKFTNLHLKNANYTTCAPQQNTWSLQAQQITLLRKQGRAVAKHMYLNVHDTPIFYFPYFNYPIDNQRHSGFLFPSYGSTSNSGYELIIPFYWNIAPNYDMTLAARWLSERGMENQGKFRYLFTHSDGSMQWHFLPFDRRYQAFKEQNLLNPPGGLSHLDPRIVALQTDNHRHAINYRHHGKWQRWQFNILFDYVSDDNYFIDLGNDIKTASTIQLPQRASLSYYGDHWSHFFNIEEYQVLQPLSKPINPEIYKRQPQWLFQATYPQQWLNTTLGLQGEIVNFNHHPDLITQQSLTTGQRLHLRPSISLPWQKPWFFFIPQLQLDWLHYTLDLDQEALTQALPRTPSRTIPLYNLDSGLIFERSFHYQQLTFTQTLEPRIYYLYVPFHAQHFYPNFDSGIINFSYNQLFRDNRFSGGDRISDANQISLSLTSRLIPAQGGQEVLRASIGQIFYFSNRRVSLCEELGEENICHLFEDANATSHRSDLIAQAGLNLNPRWSGNAFWEWNTLHQKTEQAAFNLQYHPAPQKAINFNYYWLRHDLAQTDFTTGETGSLHQAELSAFWPIRSHWQVISRWHYDLKQRQSIETLAGIEYNGCCLALQLIGSRYRQSGIFFYPKTYATGISAQIVFKGLSPIGVNSPDSKLLQKIPGYSTLAQRQHTTKHALKTE